MLAFSFLNDAGAQAALPAEDLVGGMGPVRGPLAFADGAGCAQREPGARWRLVFRRRRAGPESATETTTLRRDLREVDRTMRRPATALRHALAEANKTETLAAARALIGTVTITRREALTAQPNSTSKETSSKC